MLKYYALKTSQERLSQFTETLSITNRTPEYYVNWSKVISNTRTYERELNTLNYLLGKENIRKEAKKLFIEQPNLLKAIPSLIASRVRRLDVLLIDGSDFSVELLNFVKPDINEIEEYLDFMEKSGLFNFLKSNLQRNLVDYVYGVETGLDSNARKNRSGSTMEGIVSHFVKQICLKSPNRFEYSEQASAPKIKNAWNVNVPVDKSTRRFDGAVYDKELGHLYLIETNYYGGGGSKLKAVSGEFSELNTFLSKVPNITFIWITDGQGWKTARLPLEEAFDKIDNIFNLDMLRNDYLHDLLVKNY